MIRRRAGVDADVPAAGHWLLNQTADPWERIGSPILGSPIPTFARNRHTTRS